MSDKVDTKLCNKCKLHLTLDSFVKNKNSRDGKSYYCRKCMAGLRKIYHGTPQGRKTATDSCRRWREKNPDKVRKCSFNARMSLYGITKNDFVRMLTEQQAACKVCGIWLSMAEKQIKTNCTIDHDHFTNKVRGLLCNECNLILCHSKDSSSRLRKLANYLDDSGTIDRFA
jgi:Recombination endonuclease VII